jgi:hypothetical protein
MNRFRNGRDTQLWHLFMQVLHFDPVKRRSDTKEGRLFSRETQVFRLGQAVQMGSPEVVR